ncbi:MAG: MFS transporter [Pseudomonadota bacterium]
MSDPTALPQPFVERVFGVRRDEFVAVAWSFVYFFCVLSSYYMLRSVREGMATAVGASNVPWLFSGTFVAMLVIAPVFGLIASRLPRRIFLPWVYFFFVLNILAFRGLFALFPEGTEYFSNVGVAFFIWLSVFNLFVVSVFWSFMADIYSKTQSRRLFGFISAGGSAGSMLGPGVSSLIVVPLGFENLLPISACILLVAVICIGRLKAWVAVEHEHDAQETVASGRALGGKWWTGIAAVFREPYLVWMACGSVIASLMGTALYIFNIELAGQYFDITDTRVQFFARLDFFTGALAFLAQLLVVRHSVSKLGVGITLALMPLLSIVGFSLLAANPAFIVVAVLTVVRRALGFGLTKPTSDMLYSVVPDEQKYKSKNFIDTAIYRGGDLFGAWTVRGMQTLGLGIAGIALVMVPVGLIWIGLAILLGREYKRRDEAAGLKTAA